MNTTHELSSLIINWLFEKKPIPRFSAILDLVLSSTPIEKTIKHRNKQIHLCIGQLLITDNDLAYKWGWSRNKVRSFLKRLQTDSLINISRDNNKTIITIQNYIEIVHSTNQLFKLIIKPNILMKQQNNVQQDTHLIQQKEQQKEQSIDFNIINLNQSKELKLEQDKEYKKEHPISLNKAKQLTIPL